jgi:hypothetical protein
MLTWQRVTISGADPAEAATGLMQAFNKAWEAAHCPDGAEVFTSNVTGQSAAAPRIYFFSPKSADIARDALRRFSPESCEQPDFRSVRKVKL